MRHGLGHIMIALCGALVPVPAVAQPPEPAPPEWSIVDGHSDFAIHYLRTSPPWSVRAHDLGVRLPGQADIPRWRIGRVGGALVTVASDRPPGASDHFPRLLASLDWLDALVARHAEVLAHVRSLAELRTARQPGNSSSFLPSREVTRSTAHSTISAPSTSAASARC